MTFSKMLTTFRQRAGMAKIDLANAVGIKPEYIVMVEHGDKKPFARATLEKIMDALSLSKDERRELSYAATKERIDEHDLAVIQDYRAGFISDLAIKEGIHGHLTANAECPYCHKDFSIDVKGEDITVTGKVSTKAKKF